MVTPVRIQAQNHRATKRRQKEHGGIIPRLFLRATLLLLLVMLMMKQCQVLHPPSHNGRSDYQETIFTALGEVPESLLRDESLSVVPVYGNWSHNAWKSAYSQLHGNNMKMICCLQRHGTILTRVSDHNERLPYKVLLRPVSKGGGNEYLAYKVAQELGIHGRIPTQTILSRPFP